MRQIVFDLETTGFKYSQGHRIVEIGAIELLNGAVTGRNFHAYVNPERDMPDEAYRVHGLSGAFLSDKPIFTDPSVAPAMLEFFGDAVLIAHNGVGFDLPFLQDELKGAKLAALKNEIIDTLFLARKKFPGAPASLDALCARFGIDTSIRERDGHGALLDSQLLASVYIELTGGAQAGLDFKRESDVKTSGGGGAQKARAAKSRPKRLASLVTDEERSSHEAFVDEMGDDALWRTIA